MQYSHLSKIWHITINFNIVPAEIILSGTGCTITKSKNHTKVYWNNCGRSELILKLEEKLGTIWTVGGQVCPFYTFFNKGMLKISNVVSNLFEIDQILYINPDVLAQNLTGIPYPLNNMFTQFTLLEASAVYSINKSGILRCYSLLSNKTSLPASEIMDKVIYDWENYFKDGRDIVVLLSGGYDSRLNLAIAKYVAKKQKNAVYAYHEIKDQSELEISSAVATCMNVELVTVHRSHRIMEDNCVFFNPDFIELQSGFYRENLVRWHRSIEEIKLRFPDAHIMGLGAEAHKGKFYNLISSIENDSDKYLSIDTLIINYIKQKLDLKTTKKTAQNQYMLNLMKNLKEFECDAAKIDYMHYHSYITNGYGHRCFNLQQNFGIYFPFLDNDFLVTVLNLPRKDKENFELVTNTIRKLDANLMDIPFTSGNMKSTQGKSFSIRSSVKKIAKASLGSRYFNLFPPRKKGRLNYNSYELSEIVNLSRKSNVNAKLIELALRDAADMPFLRLDYLLQACLYLSHIEKKYNVDIVYQKEI